MSDRKRRFWEPRSEPVLLAALGVLAVVLFTLTSFAARAFHAERTHHGQDWYQRGEQQLAAGHPAAAAEHFRNALVYDRENDQYSLRLAQSLAAIGRLNEAEAYLRNLWERAPGDGTINLELARLAARASRVDQAHRYYHNAIYGVWESDPEQQRRRVRLELIGFLLERGYNHEATAELAGLVEELPKDDAPARVQAAQFYAQAGAHERALAVFRNALDIGRPELPALVGAGESAFHLGRYRLAETYLARAERLDRNHPRIAELLPVARAAQEFDPFAYRLSGLERARRVARAYQLTLETLARCAEKKQQPLDAEPPQTPLQQSYRAGVALRPRASAARLRRDPADFDAVMDFVFNSQQLAARECGPGTAAEQALVLLAERRPAE